MALITSGFAYDRGFYRCSVATQTMKSDQVTFVGMHKDSKSNEDVNYLHFPYIAFTTFPKNIHENFPNLQVLLIDHCQLGGIFRNNIGKLKSLGSIIVNGCGLVRLKGDLFRDLKLLEVVNFEKNKLAEIDPTILDGLPLLRYVNFKSNKNINIVFDSRDEASKVTLDDVKNVIRARCKPKPTEPNPATAEPSTSEVAKLKQEIEELKTALEKQETIAIIQRVQNKNLMAKNEKEAITDDLKRAIADDAFKDFTIKVGEASFKVHKLLFAARCKTIGDLLRNNIDTEELNLQDIPEETFKIIHDFVYTNEIPDDGDQNWTELFTAAWTLKVVELVKKIAAKLIENVDENNAMEVLTLANKFNHDPLRKKSFEIIKTKIFPDRRLDDELARMPEKLKKLIEIKRKLEEEFAALNLAAEKESERNILGAI